MYFGAFDGVKSTETSADNAKTYLNDITSTGLEFLD